MIILLFSFDMMHLFAISLFIFSAYKCSLKIAFMSTGVR